jgi:hypothetical protein
MKALAFLILCFASIVLAEDFKTIDGKEYKNVTVSRVEPDGIVVTFSGGIVKIPFTELSPEIQRKYGYDLKAAADFQKQTYEGDVARTRQLAAAQEKRRQELEEFDKSHPQPAPSQASPSERQSIAASMHGTALDQRPSGPTMLIYGVVMNVVDEGLLVSVRETNSIGSERIPNYATVLLIGKFPGFYDEDKIQAVGRLIGAYEYTSVMGSKRTSRALAGASVTKLVEFPSNVR